MGNLMLKEESQFTLATHPRTEKRSDDDDGDEHVWCNVRGSSFDVVGGAIYRELMNANDSTWYGE